MKEGIVEARPKPKRSRAKKILLALVIVLVAVAVGLAIAYQNLTYEPLPEAKAAMQSDNRVTVQSVKGGLLFEPATGDVLQPNVIFYPGGFVKPESYAPFARGIAETGHRVFIARMPFELAFFGQNKADAFLKQYPEDGFVIGGHSLGGVFASRYAAKHLDSISGVYFMASYADDGGSLSGMNLSALQMTATKDAILQQDKWEAAKTNLPADTTYVSIEGGNHGQFGTYGKQKGDNDPSITAEQQREEVIQAMTAWLKGIQ
ncbi:alpha/beta fold hydrolase [Gorillibacterium sp. CAU 1737]|uniref:alpha/beta fold hydrolase n=1 Tax=Gorillibacterium sp. CAU 1737 TaxID=3140362 RepID=UPI003260DDE2